VLVLLADAGHHFTHLDDVFDACSRAYHLVGEEL
jgi:hypothetical protein